MNILTESPIRLDPLIDQVRSPDRGGIAIFLGAKASDFVTGTAIPVDGGFSISG